MKFFHIALLVLLLSPSLAQGQVDSLSNNDSDTAQIQQRKKYPRYLDDQLFVSFTYNLLTNVPSNVYSTSLPNAYSIGYIRDIPVNRRRNIGFGAGIAFSFHTYYQNMLMSVDENGMSNLQVLDKGTYKGNRFSMQMIEIPIQFRYRTSTFDKKKFWRFYAGFTPAWIYKNADTYKNNGQKVRYYNIDYFRDWIYYVNLQVGYGAFSVKVDYSLTSMFKDKEVPGSNGSNLSDLRTWNLGVLFYIL